MVGLLSYQYRHRVEIQRKVEEQDSETGDIEHTWATLELDTDTTLNNVPANVLTGPGREPVITDTKLAETSARIILPWFPGLLQTDRIVWLDEGDNRIFDIIAIETDVTAQRQYRLRCRDGVSDGS